MSKTTIGKDLIITEINSYLMSIDDIRNQLSQYLRDNIKDADSFFKYYSLVLDYYEVREWWDDCPDVLKDFLDCGSRDGYWNRYEPIYFNHVVEYLLDNKLVPEDEVYEKIIIPIMDYLINYNCVGCINDW